MNLQTKPKLILILDSLDLSGISKTLSSMSTKGPRGYNPEAILRALLAQQIENIPTRAALVRRLKTDPVFRYCCGFSVAGSVPSEATFSRYYSRLATSKSLKEYYYQEVNKTIELDIIDTKILAIDSTKLEAYERPIAKRKVDKNNTNTPDWGSKFDSHQNQITWYGWKVHLVSDCKGELPLDFILTPANKADSVMALPLVEKVYQRLKANVIKTPEYWLMDAGYDVKENYSEIHHKYQAQAIIPINKRRAKEPPAAYYDFKGTPLCSGGYKMVY
jgi:transposase